MYAGLWCRKFLVALIIAILAAGCSQGVKNDSGVYVMFDGRPNLSSDHHVYYNGFTVGEIKAVEFKGSTITRMTIAIAPQYKNRVDDHWAFYVDRGRLLAVRLKGGGAPLRDGDKLCGFKTSTAYHWFKFKTLLSDRAYKAGKRANHLFARFEYS